MSSKVSKSGSGLGDNGETCGRGTGNGEMEIALGGTRLEG